MQGIRVGIHFIHLPDGAASRITVNAGNGKVHNGNMIVVAALSSSTHLPGLELTAFTCCDFQKTPFLQHDSLLINTDNLR